MNILMLAEVSAATVIGGAERVLREQMLGLQGRGHWVGSVVRMPGGDSRPQMAVGAAVEHRYTVSRRNEPAFVLSSVVRSVRAFDRARRDLAPDVAVIHQSVAGLGALLRRRASIGSWVYVCHSLAHEEYVSRTSKELPAIGPVRRALNRAACLWIERAVIRRCARIVVLSEFMKRRVTAVHGVPESRIRVVPGGADPERFRPPDDPTAVRRRLKLPDDKVILFVVRNLVPRMGLDNLLQAMAKLGDEAGDLLLLIGGEGGLRRTLERLIGELRLARHVRLLGFVEEEELPLYYQAADLVLMPTQELEGFGLVTVEALACGTPVVGTPVGAIPEVLARLDQRLIAEGNDGPSLAQAIRRTLCRFRDEPGEQERLSRAARQLVLNHYTWERHNEQLETVLTEAIKDREG
ncbi:MAG: glycosyltransferase family 4 protein [Nitrospirota bacterium]